MTIAGRRAWPAVLLCALAAVPATARVTPPLAERELVGEWVRQDGPDWGCYDEDAFTFTADHHYRGFVAAGRWRLTGDLLELQAEPGAATAAPAPERYRITGRTRDGFTAVDAVPSGNPALDAPQRWHRCP